MKYGIQMYTLRNFMKTKEELETTFQRVSDMGYENIQITPPAFVDMKEFAQMLQKYGLKADSAMCDVYQIPEKIDEIAEAAKLLETDVCRTNSIRTADRYSKEGYESFAAHLNLCGKLLYEKGLKFMYHFHSFEFISFGDVRGIDILLNQTDPKYVMFQPDVFWLTAAGTEPSDSLKMFQGRAKYIHLKDYQIAKSDTAVLEEIKQVSAPVGTGNLNWPGIIRTAREIGITNFVIEDDMGVLDPFESAEQSIKNIKKLGF